MSDILKEAIADAKTVRETALSNAKNALQEAFAPHLKSMLSAKLKEDEMDDVMMDDEPEVEIEVEPEMEPEMEGNYMKDDGFEDEMGAPEEEEPAIEGEEEEEMDDLNLEDIIKELEAEINEEGEEEEPVEEQDDAYDEKNAPSRDGLAETDDAYDEKNAPSRDGLAEEDEDEEEKDDIEENDVSSGIGNADNSKNAKADASSGIGNGKVGMEESLINVQKELDEYKEAVAYLKDKLHEVNVLNAKLLFTNKLFKEYALDKDQKVKVVETMDRAQTTREIKLVYSTLFEAFSQAGKITRKRNIKESASTRVASTKPKKKIITEEDQVAARFKKLAGIL